MLIDNLHPLELMLARKVADRCWDDWVELAKESSVPAVVLNLCSREMEISAMIKWLFGYDFDNEYDNAYALFYLRAISSVKMYLGVKSASKAYFQQLAKMQGVPLEAVLTPQDRVKQEKVVEEMKQSALTSCGLLMFFDVVGRPSNTILFLIRLLKPLFSSKSLGTEPHATYVEVRSQIESYFSSRHGTLRVLRLSKTISG